MAKKKEVNKIVERCEYCIHNKGENETFKHMWFCDQMKRYLPQGYSFCRASKQQKGEFKVDKVKYKQYESRIK